jgi:hypothetical protein
MGKKGESKRIRAGMTCNFNGVNFFKRLQHLRNLAAYEYDSIDERVTSYADMMLLFGFFEDYAQGLTCLG